MTLRPLVYVYLDNPLPSYAAHSLALARRRYSGPIHLLINRDDTPDISGIDVVDIRSWYSPTQFKEFAAKSDLDALFRGGFWLKAVERFFVLEQYMNLFSIDAFLHAELDVLIVELEGLTENLDSFGSGIFIPLQQRDRAYASLIYVNHALALQEVLAFFGDHHYLGNEMKMLASYLVSGTDFSHVLPSETALSSGAWPIAPSTVPLENWLVDCSGFGFWIFGYDPRNLPGTVWNHFGESSSGDHYANLKVTSNFSGTRIVVTNQLGASFALRAIHVHSKIFSRLRVPGLIWLYVTVSNLPIKFPIVASLGAFKASLIVALTSRRGNKVFADFSPFLREFFWPFVRHLVGSSPRILSERQRAVVSSFVPLKPLGNSSQGESPNPVTPISPEYVEDAVRKLELEGLPIEMQERLATQVAIFLFALSLRSPTCIVVSGDVAFEPRRLFNDKRQILFVSNKKSYADSKHALTYWADYNFSNQWSFDAEAQVINPRIVREMFPAGEEDVINWARLGINRSEPSLSAFQSYGLWLYNLRRDTVALARP